MSIFAYSPQPLCEKPFQCQPGEAGPIYGKYIAVNLSWILGSLGTLCLDMCVFVQYFLYEREEGESSHEEGEEVVAAAAEDAVETVVGRRTAGSNVALEDES